MKQSSIMMKFEIQLKNTLSKPKPCKPNGNNSTKSTFKNKKLQVRFSMKLV